MFSRCPSVCVRAFVPGWSTSLQRCFSGMSYVLNGFDLHTVFYENDLLKYADDTYTVIHNDMVYDPEYTTVA